VIEEICGCKSECPVRNIENDCMAQEAFRVT